MPDQIRAHGIAAATISPLAVSSFGESFSTSLSGSLVGLPFDLIDSFGSAFTSLDRYDLIAIAVTLGIACFAVVSSILLVRTRLRAAATEATLRDQISALRIESDRFSAMLRSEPQVLVSWAAADNESDIAGDTRFITNAPTPQRVLAFGTWLEPDKAQAMERAVDALRSNGESFAMQLMTLSGHAVEAEGRVIGGRAVLRLRDVTGVKRELAELAVRYEKLAGDVESLRALLDAIPAPVWARDLAGTLVFANPAFARAVDAKDAADAVARGVEMLGRLPREEASRARAAGQIYSARVPAIVAGNRRTLDVIDVPTRRGSAGIGIDATEAEAMRSEIKRLLDAHRRTLDQLPTAVATFGSDQKLSFYNAAFRSLFDLDAGFLDQGPTDSALLDLLRAERKLPEERDFREWKARLAPARWSHAARRHDAKSARRRHLSVRGHHRAAGADAALRRAQPRAGRNARQPRGRRRCVWQRWAPAPAQFGLRAHVAARSRAARRAPAHRVRPDTMPKAA
jgi:PAS domain-containing protein